MQSENQAKMRVSPPRAAGLQEDIPGDESPKSFVFGDEPGNYILDTQANKVYSGFMKKPETLQEAIVYFSDPQRAFEYACELRWPDGKVSCPRCGGRKHSFIKTRRIWFCYDCNPDRERAEIPVEYSHSGNPCFGQHKKR